MTRETKIGLVVGLGFIVVFAILLSHKGTAEHVGPPSDVWPRSGDLQMVNAGSAIDEVVPQEEQEVVDHGATKEVTEPIDVELPPPVLDMPMTSADEPGIEPPAVASDPGAAESSGMPDERDVAPTDTAPVTVEPARPEAPEKREKGAPARPREEDAQPEPVRPAPAVEHLAKAEGKTHEVQKGDTLYSLARKYGKTPAPRVIDRIYAANREQLKSRDALKLGQVLTIPMDLFEPVADPLARPPAPASRPARRAEEGDNAVRDSSGGGARATVAAAAKKDSKERPAAADSPAGDWKWYEVKSGDTFYSIARKVLGTSTRCREIQKLNKSTVPDPLKLRPGDKIKIPVGRPPGLETAGLETPRR